MLTRLMFIRESSPLTAMNVEVNGHGAYVTDSDGAITLEAQLVNKTIVRVSVDGQWYETHVEPKSGSGLYVVDVGRMSHQELLAGGKATLGERYEFLRPLGRGGMGIVVEARDRLLGRRVAIKMLSHELQEVEEARRIFLIEGQALAKLNHPNLVSVYDVTEIEGRAMMVMEFIEGRTLENKLKEKTVLPAHEGIDVALQILQALAYLHEQGTIHRDIKPANIMVDTKNKRVRVIDFGLARSFEQLAARGTQIRGTPGYMAPEQIRGEDLTAATDIYQTGASLYEVFCGRLPFSDAIVVSHLEKDVPRIESILPTIDLDVAEIIHSCLVKGPADRPTAIELIAAFEAVKAGMSVPVSDSKPSTGTGLSGEFGTQTNPVIDSSFTRSSLTVEQTSGLKGGVVGVIIGIVLAVGATVAFMMSSSKEDVVASAPTSKGGPEAPVVLPVVEKAPPKPTEGIEKPEDDTLLGEAAGMGVRKAIRIALASSDVVAPALLKRKPTPRYRPRSVVKAAPKIKLEPQVAKVEPKPESVAKKAPEPVVEPQVIKPDPEPVEVAKPDPIPLPVARTAPVLKAAPVVEKPKEPTTKKKKKKKAAPVSF